MYTAIAISILALSGTYAASLDGNAITWKAIENKAGWFEGYLPIPVDHRNLSAFHDESWSLYCQRHPPINPSQGLLFFNFGGPGNPAAKYFDPVYGFMSQAIKENMDIVGCDPRGIGQSIPSIDGVCAGPLQTNPLTDYNTISEYEAIVNDKMQKDLEECAVNNSLIMQHMGTRQFAMDLELLREDMGYDKLNMVGYSYGTRVGSVYATLFPAKVGHMVLDGNMPPSPNAKVLLDGYADNGNRSMNYMLSVCEKNKEDCVFANDVGQNLTYKTVFEKYQTAVLSKDTFEVLLPGETRVQSVPQLAMLTTALNCYLRFYEYSTGYLTSLSVLEAMAIGGTGNKSYIDLVEDVPTAVCHAFELDHSLAYNVVLAMDAPQRYSRQQMAAYGDQITAVSGLIGRKLWVDLGAGFLFETIFGDDQFRADPIPEVSSSAAVLVIGNLYDFGTQYAWSQAMAARFVNGNMLTTGLAVHTSYLLGRLLGGVEAIFQCVERLADDYLVNGNLPAEASTCFAPMNATAVLNN